MGIGRERKSFDNRRETLLSDRSRRSYERIIPMTRDCITVVRGFSISWQLIKAIAGRGKSVGANRSADGQQKWEGRFRESDNE